MGSPCFMVAIKLSAQAHAVALLHAFKFPHSAVCGVLVGFVNDEANIVVEHAVAVAHGHITLTPMLEVALSQVECKYNKEGLKIVGYYQANAHLQDNANI